MEAGCWQTKHDQEHLSTITTATSATAKFPVITHNKFQALTATDDMTAKVSKSDVAKVIKNTGPAVIEMPILITDQARCTDHILKVPNSMSEEVKTAEVELKEIG